MPSHTETDLVLSGDGINTSDILTNLNLTQDMIHYYINFLRNRTDKLHSEADPCLKYCDGSIREITNGYKEVHGYISLVICVFGSIANMLNIMVLTRKEMKKTPINKILKWLSVADMFVMIEYIPFTIYKYIFSEGRYDRSYIWAVYLLFHMHFTQILHTISILLTVTLAIWRYVAIRHPHGTFATYLLSHCNEAIILSFLLSPALCFPTYFVFNVKENPGEDDIILYTVDAEEGTILYSSNFWIHSVIIKLIPCCILTVISFILIKVLCDASKRKIKLKEYSNPNCSSTAITNNNTTTASNSKTALNSNQRRSLKGERSGGGGGTRPDRTTMLLVAVLLLFLITEFPQGILGLLSGISSKCFFVMCYGQFGEMMDLLALINAAIGFVLYGLMSKQFRTSFKMLFLKHRGSRAEMTRVTGIQSTCV